METTSAIACLPCFAQVMASLGNSSFSFPWQRVLDENPTWPEKKDLVDGLEHYLFSHILEILIPVDSYFSEGFKPPTRDAESSMS